MKQSKFSKQTYKEMQALLRHFRGKDIRLAIPAMLAVIEYYVQEQFPNMRRYAVKEIEFLIDRLKGNKKQNKNENNSEGKYNIKISS